MHIPINTMALLFLMPTALLIPLCAWASFRIAADRKHHGGMVALIIVLVVISSLWLMLTDFGLGMSPGHQDGTYYNSFYLLQLFLSPVLALCASVFAYRAYRHTLYAGAGLVALGAAVPSIWWSASRTSAAVSQPLIAALLVVWLGALVGMTAVLLPERAPADRLRRLLLWMPAGAVGAMVGLLLGKLLTGSPWEVPRQAADPLLPTLLLIAVLADMALISALVLTALSVTRPARLLPAAAGLALATATCWVALSDLPALNQTAVSAPLNVSAPRMLSLPSSPPPQPSANSVQFSPNGQWMAVGLAPDSIHPERPGGAVLWRTSDWSVVAANIQVGTGPTWPLWTPDGQRLILVSGSGAVGVLKTATWAIERSWSRSGPLAGGAITPDGRTLWLAEATALTAWNLNDNTPGARIPLDEQPTSPPVIAPNSSWVAVGTGAVVGVWHLPAGTSWQQLPGHINHAIRLSVSPDSMTLAVGSWDAVLRVWRVSDGLLITSIPDGGESVVFSPDGAYLAGASFRGVSGIYQAGSWARRAVLQSGASDLSKATVFAYSPDGEWIAGAGQSLNMPLWHLPALRALPAVPTPEPPTATPALSGPLQPITPANAGRLAQVGALQQDGLGAAYLPLSGTLAVAGSDIRLFPDPLSESRPARRWGTQDNGFFLAASPDGKLLATRGASPYDLELWNVDSGTRLAHLTGSTDNLLAAAFSPDSKTVAAAGGQGIVFTWPVSGTSKARQWPAGMERVNSLIFSPDGAGIWIGGDGPNGLRLARVSDGATVHSIPATPAGVAAMALSADGQTLAVTSDSSYVQLWRTSDGTRLARMGPMDGPSTIAWSPDGALIAAGGEGHTLDIWDSGSGKLLTTLTGHAAQVYTVLFAPDRRLLVSVGGDSTVRLWGVR